MNLSTEQLIEELRNLEAEKNRVGAELFKRSMARLRNERDAGLRDAVYRPLSSHPQAEPKALD